MARERNDNSSRQRDSDSIKLSAETRLEIRDEVEKRVKERVADVECKYKICLAILIAAAAVVGYSSWSDAHSKLNQIGGKYTEITNLVTQASVKMEELKVIDNVVTAKDLKKNIDKVISDSTRLLAELRTEQEFHLAITDVLNDSRSAFEKLRAIASDSSNSHCEKAKIVLQKIDNRISITYPDIISVRWDDGIDTQKISFEECVNKYKGVAQDTKLHWVYFIGSTSSESTSPPNQRGFLKGRRLRFLYNVICTDESLMDVLYAEFWFKKIVDVKELNRLPPYSLDSLKKWWAENGKNFED